MRKSMLYFIELVIPYKGMSILEQRTVKEEIMALFREFWKADPSEEEFSKFTSGLVIFPEMIYIMIKQREKNEN